MFKTIITLLLLMAVSFATDKKDLFQITCENKYPVNNTLEFYRPIAQLNTVDKPDTTFSVIQIEGEYCIVKKYEKSDTLRVKVVDKVVQKKERSEIIFY